MGYAPHWMGWWGPQQQPPEVVLTGLLWILTLDFSALPAVAPGPILFLISAAMVMKACSTLVALLALVSRKGMPRLSANSWTRQTTINRLKVLHANTEVEG